jgi:multisubunit Na+/H+ antiporter MnhC subunit
MMIKSAYHITVILDALAVLMLIAVYFISRDNMDKDSTGTKIYLMMGLNLFVGSISDIITTVLPVYSDNGGRLS